MLGIVYNTEEKFQHLLNLSNFINIQPTNVPTNFSALACFYDIIRCNKRAKRIILIIL